MCWTMTSGSCFEGIVVTTTVQNSPKSRDYILYKSPNFHRHGLHRHMPNQKFACAARVLHLHLLSKQRPRTFDREALTHCRLVHPCKAASLSTNTSSDLDRLNDRSPCREGDGKKHTGNMPPSEPMPTSQRAAQFTPPNVAMSKVSQIARVPSIPKSGTYTFVRVLSSALNPIDYKLASLPQPLPRLMIGSAPFTPGIDFVGRVWQTTHPDLKAGDLCFGKHHGPSKHGTCAEYTLHKGKDGIVKVPEGYLPLLDQGRKLEELGAVGVAGMTALQVLTMGDLPYNRSGGTERGGKVFINGGSGGTGTYAVQMAKHGLGCDTVIASCSASNAELVRSLGADEVIDYRSTNVVDALKEWSGRNGGQAFDMIIDNVGNDANIYWQAHHYLKSHGGKFVMVGAGTGLSDVLRLTKMMLWPSWLGGGKRKFQLFLLGGTKKQQWDLVGKWMVEGKLRTVIEDDNVFDLASVDKAFEKLKTGRTRGKIVIKVAEDGQ